MGKIVMLQTADGDNLACGVLKEDGARADAVKTTFALTENLSSYNDTTVKGLAEAEFFPDNSFLEGLPVNCKDCKMAIQEGTSCFIL
jgi:hypothetical protein